ncbi:hypothetical protein R1O63_001080 [Campylobacter jejuni]|nr:hypothetical protein [Campylobacter jejuni]
MSNSDINNPEGKIKEMKRDLEIDKTPYSNYVFLLNPNDKKTIKLRVFIAIKILRKEFIVL